MLQDRPCSERGGREEQRIVQSSRKWRDLGRTRTEGDTPGGTYETSGPVISRLTSVRPGRTQGTTRGNFGDTDRRGVIVCDLTGGEDPGRHTEEFKTNEEVRNERTDSTVCSIEKILQERKRFLGRNVD